MRAPGPTAQVQTAVNISSADDIFSTDPRSAVFTVSRKIAAESKLSAGKVTLWVSVTCKVMLRRWRELIYGFCDGPDGHWVTLLINLMVSLV